MENINNEDVKNATGGTPNIYSLYDNPYYTCDFCGKKLYELVNGGLRGKEMYYGKRALENGIIKITYCKECGEKYKDQIIDPGKKWAKYYE